MNAIDVVLDLESGQQSVRGGWDNAARKTDQEVNVTTVEVVLRMPLDLLDGRLGVVAVGHGGDVDWGQGGKAGCVRDLLDRARLFYTCWPHVARPHLVVRNKEHVLLTDVLPCTS